MSNAAQATRGRKISAPRLRGKELLEQGRRLAAGALCSGVVHEFANLLTVLDGLSQITALGIPWSDGQRMIKPPAERGLTLIEAFRHYFAERASEGPVDYATEMRHLDSLLRIRLRGRRTHLEFECDGLRSLPGQYAPHARLTLLLAALAPLEAARIADCYPTRVRVVGTSIDGRAEWLAHFDGMAALLPDALHSMQSLLAAAGALAAQFGAELRFTSESGADGILLRVTFPRSA